MGKAFGWHDQSSVFAMAPGSLSGYPASVTLTASSGSSATGCTSAASCGSAALVWANAIKYNREGGTVTAGEGGEIRIRYYDGRMRTAIGYVGEDGILADTAYKVLGGKLVKA